ncbi:TrbL Type IV secretory pathway, TrbL components [uncultured Caudovirales phage]|uniref:TrbL Type IV secretory pathway, TrbL components n=1 Tax=uncultured Caudovirales phage TaxID=2100421 RepID=A0A6J5R5S3_9CAUD|nr:TrbL Type IV secretory pathway, TrbL components [uncultured Caudovirales phage]
MDPHSVNQLLELIRGTTLNWIGPLTQHGIELFNDLVIISLAWNMGRLAINRAIAEEYFSALVVQAMTYGIFYFILTNSELLATEVTSSFRMAADEVSGFNLMNPTNMLLAGLKFVYPIITNVTVLGVLTGQGALNVLVALIIVLCFAWAAFLMVAAIIESYVIMACSSLFIGFTGSEFTREFGMGVIKEIMAIGAKLFTIQVMSGIVDMVARQWAGQFDAGTEGGILALLMGVLVMVGLMHVLPGLSAAFIRGGGWSIAAGMSRAVEQFQGAMGTVAGSLVQAGQGGLGMLQLGSAAKEAAQVSGGSGGGVGAQLSLMAQSYGGQAITEAASSSTAGRAARSLRMDTAKQLAAANSDVNSGAN